MSLWCCVCIVNSYSALLNWPIVILLILLCFTICSNVFCILVHDYTLYFIGSPCCVSYYNYISVWPYYIVIQYSNYNRWTILYWLTLYLRVNIYGSQTFRFLQEEQCIVNIEYCTFVPSEIIGYIHEYT